MPQHKPDYHGRSIVNLMSSLIRASGGEADYPDLSLLHGQALQDSRNLVLLVIDGLGHDWLNRHDPDGLLARHRLGAITSVFPATTAAAISSYLTGDAPLQHGLTGWFTYLRELGCVMTVLPGTPRYGGVPFAQAGIDAAALLQHRPVFSRMKSASVMVAPAFIAHSDFNRAHRGPSDLLTFQGLHEMFEQTARALRKPPRGATTNRYFYLYWPVLDTIGHRDGIESAAAHKHLREIEEAIGGFLQAAAGTDTTLLVCADHGQLDTTPADVIDLADHPYLRECLLLPLCGEPRAAFCYLRSGREQDFLGYCRDTFGERVEVVPSAQLIEEEVFGFGTPHPQFTQRCGDYCLLPQGHAIVREQLPFEKPHELIGVHGGLDPAELEVPLCLLRPDA